MDTAATRLVLAGGGGVPIGGIPIRGAPGALLPAIGTGDLVIGFFAPLSPPPALAGGLISGL